MSLDIVQTHTQTDNPLDIIEEIVAINEWACDRASSEEMIAELSGKWAEYQLYFVWHASESALLFSCNFGSKVPEHRQQEVNNLLAMANQRMWMGHFELMPEENTPSFRHTVMLRGSNGASVEQLEDLVEIALAECERFYPAFQLVAWSDKTAAEAMNCAIFETIGEA